MPSESPLLGAQTEKPHHYLYLKDFRTQQCPLFVQHKCTQHRPFTCFNWHFLNQRRRRPQRKREGTFNYSPDVYCSKYEETTGNCPDGDECVFLHRTAGDTERRYHLRYYKTSACVHETDSKGHCSKNGPHCAFAHGAQDLRAPVYDIQELQAMDSQKEGNVNETPLGSSLEKDRTLNDDPRWNDTPYVLANYKTEQCKRPPRLCRQGYACPQYHNNRDKRRGPTKFKYRSTPCPNVKHGDEWSDPSQCDNGDACGYCHSRTEQQFHPEIYKSTKCNDMVHHGYCPRGPFCAFAHVEHEITSQRDLLAMYEKNLALYMSSAPPENDNRRKMSVDETAMEAAGNNGNKAASGAEVFRSRADSLPASHLRCARAPGSEREDGMKSRQYMGGDMLSKSMGVADKGRYMQEMMAGLGLAGGAGNAGGGYVGRSNSVSAGTGIPAAAAAAAVAGNYAPFRTSMPSPFYPSGDTVESVIGNVLDEDLPLGELSASLSRDLAMDNEVFGAGRSANYGANDFMGSASVPVTIPSGSYQRASLGSLSTVQSSPPSSPGGLFTHQYTSAAMHGAEMNMGFGQSVFPDPVTSSGGSVMTQASQFAMNGLMMQQRQPAGPRLWEDNRATPSLARNVNMNVETWRKELEDTVHRMQSAEEEKLHVIKQRDEALAELNKLKREMDVLRGSSYLRCLNQTSVAELDQLPVHQLRAVESLLSRDLGTLRRVIEKAEMACVVCHERRRGSALTPCTHFLLCDACALKTGECPWCHVKVGGARPVQTQ